MQFIRLVLKRRQFMAVLVVPTLLLLLRRLSAACRLIFRAGAAAAANGSVSAGGSSQKRGIVVYYSGAGNTARVANAIYQGMKEVIACDVAPINRITPADMARYDVVAVGSPNWFKREPANVKLFLYDMPPMEGKHCVLFGTHGDQPYGHFWSMSRNVRRKGMTIIGWSDWYGSDLLHGSQPDAEWGHPDEIELEEAKAFGRRMAEHSVRINAGEESLIPEVPTPGKGEKSMWAPSVDDTGDNISFASPKADHIPEFDLTKCVYPRCKTCVENCPVNAIDFSLTAPAGSIIHEDTTISPILLKEACQHCGGLCERVCLYDAIRFEGEKRDKAINMEKCTHPECTLCIEHCPQDAIDFSVTPPLIHRRCEGGDSICFAICPENAVEFPGMAGNGAHPAPGGPRHAEEVDEATYWATHYPPGYRPHIRFEEIGSRGDILSIDTYPRYKIDENLWPYHVGEI